MLSLKKFAKGFAYQKGAIFGFGDQADDDTGCVLKISSLTPNEIENLNTVQTHNIGEERSVGFFNYEIGLRGKKNVDAVSRKMILNKSKDLLSDGKKGEFRKYRKQAKEIKELKLNWNKRMVELQEKGFNQNDVVNVKLESQKLKDLEFLKKQSHSGPFTSSKEVSQFMDAVDESKEKNQRMYVEVRFQKNTTTGLKKDHAVFRLKRNAKNLETID